MSALNEIVKAYDIRGVVPDQLDARTAHTLGVGFATLVRAPSVILGRDMRLSGPELVAAFSEGVQSTGTDVVDIGLASTDMMYFASGSMDQPGAMMTASHNPPRYNGLKMCVAGARPIGSDSGLTQIRDTAQRVLDGVGPEPAATPGARIERDVLSEFVDHVLSFVDVASLQSLKVLADTANGMGGLVVPALFDRIPQIECDLLYGELDGSFPNHPADPLQPVNQRDLRAKMAAGGYDIGLAFDGDADRVFIVDEHGDGLSGSATTALLAAATLRNAPGATVLYNLICSRAVPEVIVEHGGVPVRTRVGHSFIKETMAETGAVFGGEHSAHYYFAENYRADSGLIASLLVIDEMSRSGLPLSKLREPYERYVASGEINTQVDDPVAVMQRVSEQFDDLEQDTLDGLTVQGDDWWFNLRPSNTEPLLRLNLEASDQAVCERRVAEILVLITDS